jgi:hypothetical protein
MADDPPAKLAPEADGAAAELSLTGSAGAPFIFFEAATNYGFHNGIANITLEASRSLSMEGKLLRDRVIVAHLRMSLTAAMSLRAALNGIALMAVPQTGRPDH